MRRSRPHVFVTLFVGLLGALIPVVAVGAAPCWPPPVPGTLVEPFREPPCPYCAGHRGLGYRVEPGSVVRAVAAGRVTWAGSVAGVRYVVVRHADGLRVTYGELASTRLRTGRIVVAGGEIGRTGDTFHLGVRSGDDYLDPEPFIGRRTVRPYLVPIDATAPRPAPDPVWRCGGSATSPRRPVVPERRVVVLDDGRR